MGKHVIILGAGASNSSGYPLAADLRVILSSPTTLNEYLNLKFQPDNTNHSSFQFLTEWFKKQSESLTLFKEGCFGTVDEFSFLAGKKHSAEVQQIKQIVGTILALHNPEAKFKNRRGEHTSGFETSDYYSLVQRLFRETDEVRDDITILTYNYDPYLDFLIHRAYLCRREASGHALSAPPTQLTSGFSDRNSKAILEGNGFCFLKLHGTSVLPPQAATAEESQVRHLSYKETFWNRLAWSRTPNGNLFQSTPCPAMYFPWELISASGEFVPKEQFASLEQLAMAPHFRTTNKTLYDLCTAIWQRARREIAKAEKISFVGLSMHRFLEDGLKFLFSERVAKINAPSDTSLEIVLACPGSRYPGSDFRKAAAPNSLADRLTTTLTRVYPIAHKNPSTGYLMSRNTGKAGVGGIVCYEDFESFIRFEL